MAAAAPLIADPIVRNRGTLVGSLCHADPQGDWASVVTGARRLRRRRRGPAARRSIPVADFVTGPFQNMLRSDEIAIEAVIPAPQGTPAGGYLKLERRVGDFATVGVAVALETSGDAVTRAGIALTGVGGSTIGATDGGRGADRGAAHCARASSVAAQLAAQAAKPRTDHRGSAEYKRHIVHTFVVRILQPHQPEPRRGRPDMTSLYEEISDPSRPPTCRCAGSRSPSTASSKVAEVEPRLLLAHLLRQGFGLTGTHTGCDTTNCGACTVLVDGKAVKCCTMLAVQADGREVTTVEGLATASELHPLQEGFKEEHGLQCGFCTPGMMLAAKALLDENPDPTEDEVRWALSGNLCRCTGYQNIVKSVLWAAEKLRAAAAGDRRRGADGRDAGTGRDQDRRDGREPQAGRGQPVHPRQGQLRRRHRAARHAAHGDPAQPAGARPDQVDRHQPRRGRSPACAWCSPAR